MKLRVLLLYNSTFLFDYSNDIENELLTELKYIYGGRNTKVNR